MLVRVTLVWRLWQWGATKKTQWESVQACLWFPYKFFCSEFRWKYATIWTALAPNRSCKFHCRLLPGQKIPSGVSWRLLRWIVLKGQKWPYAFRKQNGPHWSMSALQVSQNTGCIRVEKRDSSPFEHRLKVYEWFYDRFSKSR